MGLIWFLYRQTLHARVKFKDNELAITWYDYVRVVIYFLELCSDVLLLWFFSTNTVFGLGVFSMARRHALVSLRHAAPSQRHAALYFFLRINTIIVLKRDDKPVNFYDIGWLLYQRIINTERHVLICLSPTQDQLTAANCSVDVWLPMEPTFFLQGSQCKSLWLLCPKVYTQRQFSTSISHVSIALFDFRVGCHSGVSVDNRV